MTRTAVCSAVALLVVSLAASPARAQEVRGTVTGAASAVAVPGAFVSLVDS